ncbi:unnamed protein product [Somion occarium]|uniref:Uncharacterized protein n=1 Tax=Somion occarium TaxID=3059160 RepID=A0ABP1D1E7_9APHY
MDPFIQLFCSTHDGVILSPRKAGPLSDIRAVASASQRRLKDDVSKPPALASTVDESVSSGQLLRPTQADLAASPSTEHRFNRNVERGELYIHIGAQPNNSPHFGTITVFTSAFILAAFLQRNYAALRADLKTMGCPMDDWLTTLKVMVSLDIVDTAPDNAQKIQRGDGLQYQKSHRDTNGHLKFLPDYDEIMVKLSTRFDVEYRKTYQRHLMREVHLPAVLEEILEREETISVELAPEKEALAVRRACPVEGCGIAEKHGRRNKYHLKGVNTRIEFYCPDHGCHPVSLNNPSEIETLEMNAPLRNLVRSRVYARDTEASRNDFTTPIRAHMRVTGSDYAGLYQEQLLWRQILHLPNPLPPTVFYVPLIVDWAGSKLSKSLYVKSGAYRYMEKTGQEWFLSYEKLKERGVDLGKVFDTIEGWMQEPNQFFRAWSVDSLKGLASPVQYPIATQEMGGKVALQCTHDGQVHDPLGAGSYVYERELGVALSRYLGLIPTAFRTGRPSGTASPDERPSVISIHVNFGHGDPHVGIITTTILAFLIGRKLMNDPRNRCARVKVVVRVDDVKLAGTDHLSLYFTLLNECVKFVQHSMTFRIETQEDLMLRENLPSVLSPIIRDRERIGREISPSTCLLPITYPCPKRGCGFVSAFSRHLSHGINTLAFECSTHGRYIIDLESRTDIAKIRFAEPLRQLVHTIAYAEDTVRSREEMLATRNAPQRVHLQITGWEHAGFTQEQMLWRQLMLLNTQAVKNASPVILYAPLIVDWSGAKLSKSWYEDGGYKYLKEKGMEYLLSLKVLRREGRSLNPLFRAVEGWVENPKKLFRPYSVEYIHRLYEPEAGKIP